jgi:integrase/recombinase XerD
MLQNVVDEYIAALAANEFEQRGNNHNTIMAYRNDLRQLCHYLETQGLQTWEQVTRECIDAYLLGMRELHGYQPTTIARKLAALKALFRYLCVNELVSVDPVADLVSPRVRRDAPQILSAEQINSLFAHIEDAAPGGLRDIAMLRILWATGMRASELVSLNLSDFDSEGATIVCPGRAGYTGHTGHIQRGRVLPLPPYTVEVMGRYLEMARPLLIRNAEEQALFLNHRGVRLTRQGFWLIIKRYARQIGILSITPHMLRHSFAISMLREGMELRSVKELLGHAHISSTQIYHQLAQAEVVKS